MAGATYIGTMPQKKPFKFVGILILLILLIGTGYLIYRRATAHSFDSMQAMPGQAMPVVVTELTPEPVQVWTEFSARLEAAGFAEIHPQVSGIITAVHFHDGDTVKAGQALFTIDPRPYEAARNLAKADLLSAQSRLFLAEKELARAEGLIGTNAISPRTYDARENDLDTAEAAVEAAKARLKQAQINLDYTMVKAPISGKTSRIETKKGNLVQSGIGSNTPLLTSIVDSHEIYADFEVDEQTYIAVNKAALKEGKTAASGQFAGTVPVELIIDGAPGHYIGTLDSFDNRLNTASGTIRARAIFDNKEGLLLPGMFARIKMGSLGEDEHILIPEKAIGTDQNRKFVYGVSPENTVIPMPVTLGAAMNGRRIVTSGLQDGDNIITEGIIRLQPGMPVMPMTAEQMKTMMEQQQAAAAGTAPVQGEGP